MTPATRDLFDRALCLREVAAAKAVAEVEVADLPPDDARELAPVIEVFQLLHQREHAAALTRLRTLPTNTPYYDMLMVRGLVGLQNAAEVFAYVDRVLRERTNVEPTEHVGLIMSKATVSLRTHEYAVALKWFAATRELAQQYGFASTASRMLVDTATATSYTGDTARAIALYEQALLELMDLGGFDAERLRVQLNLASCYQDVGRHADALRANETLLTNESIRSDNELRVAVNLNMALALKSLGRNDEASTCYLLARDVARSASLKEMEIKACVGLSDLYTRQHDYTQAMEWAQQALTLATAAGVEHWGLEARSMIAAGKFALGQEQEAIDDMHACITAALETGDANSAVSYATVLCEWLAERDRYREAYDLQQRITRIQRDVSERELERALEVSAIRSRLDQERESVRLRDEERNRVLHSVFPPQIAARLMHGEMPIADRVEHVALMFVDIVGFTTLASGVEPEELLNLLERLFTQLDEICHAHGCERIKTIGDAYMAVSMSSPTVQHNVERLMRAALEMIDPTRGLALPPERLRLGIHAGPVIAGVMGGARLSYDMWGDTVNVAARMEEYSAPGRIACSPLVAELLQNNAQCRLEMREPLAIHGKGLMTTYWLSASERD